MKIRRAKKKDIRDVLKLSEEFINEYRKIAKMKTKVSVSTALKYKKKIFEKDLKLGQGTIFVATEDKSFIGYIFVLTFMPGMESSRRYSPGYISDLHVCKKYRRKGIAIKLVREAEKWLRVKGKKEVSLDVGTFNKGAINIYKKLKFKNKSIKLEKKL